MNEKWKENNWIEIHKSVQHIPNAVFIIHKYVNKYIYMTELMILAKETCEQNLSMILAQPKNF